MRRHDSIWLSIGLLTFMGTAHCGSRSSLNVDAYDAGPPTSTSSSSASASSSSGTGGAGGSPVNPCAQLPDYISTVWSVDLETLGLYATDMAVDPSGDIYVTGPGPVVARFDPQGNLQWVEGQPGNPPLPYETWERIFPGPDGRFGLITQNDVRHYVVQGATPKLLGQLPATNTTYGWQMALGPAGRVYLTQGDSTAAQLSAMDETLTPLWTVHGTETAPVGTLVAADPLGRILHAKGYSLDQGYTTFGWFDLNGTSMFSTNHPSTWAIMLDLALHADGSASISGTGNAGQKNWFERFNSQGELAFYTETSVSNSAEAMIPCGIALLPSGDTWTCVNADLVGTLLTHFSAQGAIIQEFETDGFWSCDLNFMFRKIGVDSQGRVIALHRPHQLSVLTLP